MPSLRELTKQILSEQGLRPKRRLSQSFLIDKGVYDSIVRAADLSSHDQVVEVGPGLGFLTTELVSCAGSVVAIEIDPDLARALESIVAVSDNLTVVEGDILKTELTDLPVLNLKKPYKVVANIPYHITAKILKKFLTDEHRPELMVLMVQHEVAERIVAEKGRHSQLSLSIQRYAEPKIMSKVKRTSFHPAPKVDSAVIRLRTLDKEFDPAFERQLWRLIRFGFSSKRKKLLNNLSAGLQVPKEELEKVFEAADIDSGDRAQHLSLEQWEELVVKLKSQNV